MVANILDAPRSEAVVSRREFFEIAGREDSYPCDGSRAMVYLRVAHLKRFNIRFGIDAGDDVLGHVAEQLARERGLGRVARYGVNSFVFISFVESVEPIVKDLNDLFLTVDSKVDLRARAGYILRKGEISAEEAFERARYACDLIADDDSNCCRLFDDELKQLYERHSYIVEHIDDAIAAGEIRAYAQPIVRLLTGQVCEVETLARWESTRFGRIFPAEFVPLLEEHHLIHKLDIEVFRLACSQWKEARNVGINVPFSINLSRLDFEQGDIFKSITSIMNEYEVPVDQVHIEVTESALTHDFELVEREVRRFRETGFELFLDDFGTGYSSLSSLEKIDFDVVKLDIELISEIEENERARVVLADVISMVKRLGMQTLCEGVETQEQLDFLLAVGCEKGQGYLFGHPLAHEQVMERLENEAILYEESLYDAYFDTIGQGNMLDGTSAEKHGVQAANFLGREPIGIVENENGELRLLSANVAFQRMLDELGHGDFTAFTYVVESASSNARAQIAYAVQKARESGEEETVEIFMHGVLLTMHMSLIAHAGSRDAFLVRGMITGNELRVTESALLAGVLESANRMMFWKDAKRRFLGANRAFLDYFGFESADEIIGKTDEDIGWHPDPEPFRQGDLDVLSGKTISAVRGQCVRKGELRQIVVSKRALYANGNVVGLVGFFEDAGAVS